jgi:hypothetical protein
VLKMRDTRGVKRPKRCLTKGPAILTPKTRKGLGVSDEMADCSNSGIAGISREEMPG